MRLISFTVERFRSITQARKIRMGATTVLIGPNNEGKSNIIRALAMGMGLLTQVVRLPELILRRPRYWSRDYYDWERDYPVHLQERERDGQSLIQLEFDLSDREIQLFRDAIGSRLNGSLPINVTVGRDSFDIRVAKQGRGSKTLSQKSRAIARFVAERLEFQHIPAVRTAASAQQLVSAMVESGLSALETDGEYLSLLARIEALQEPILARMSDAMRVTLVKFLPNVRAVTLRVAREQRVRALRSACEIVIDDGSPTLLQHKGDGVQSLAGLAIMRQSSLAGETSKHLVLAIEEPESHLHPKAVHELHAVLRDLAVNQQIILSTHCPLFVERTRIDDNVIVYKQRARAAKSIAEIRTLLGVRASDNLRHAELVLLVEGNSDKAILTALFRQEARGIVGAMEEGRFVIEGLGGGGNLSYVATMMKDALCRVHCFLDDDQSGRGAFEQARSEGVLNEREVHFSCVPGLHEAEIEDMLDPLCYAEGIERAYGVDVRSDAFKGRGKWSERLGNTFKQQGKPWNERVKKEVKARVAEVVGTSEKALVPQRRTAFDALVRTITALLLGEAAMPSD
jgi:putative ATP-dependent endonuclease of the OLD family